MTAWNTAGTRSRNGGTPDEFFGEDDGPGIAENVAAQVFDAGWTTRADGTGLGLTIVDDVASAHGWTTTLSEPPGGGTRFEFGGVVVLEGDRYAGTSTHGDSIHD